MRSHFYPCNIMNEVAADTAAKAIPPFFFHYIIVFLVVVVILCICVLKFKYLYWYDQPLTFRFTLRRFFRGSGGRHRTSIMNPLSLGERCYNAVVYSFLHHVNHDTVRVFRGIDEDVPFERISQLLRPMSKNEGIAHKNAGLTHAQSCDTIRLLLSQETFGLSAFIGVYYGDKCNHNTISDAIKGVSVLTPRIMLSFDSSLATSSYKSVSIYMSEYLAWNKYTMSERESLELVETTEYIQKSREIAGEQTLYRYCEIPWFVIPFSTVYSYVFKMPSASGSAHSRFGHGITVIPVSSANFALFYAFVNEHTRDFRTCILNELTQLQSLVEHGLYRIYMLMLNDTRVIAVYLFTQSAFINEIQGYAAGVAGAAGGRNKKKTKGNRIADLHDYVSSTSTALVKYLPPVIRPKYDAFGKRISTMTQTRTKTPKSRESVVMRLVSSIQDKTLCETQDFLRGFQYSIERVSGIGGVVCIDTLAHNHRIIDPLVMKESVSWPLLTKDKWYYILYNAIIHEETLCKDILVI